MEEAQKRSKKSGFIGRGEGRQNLSPGSIISSFQMRIWDSYPTRVNSSMASGLDSVLLI